MPSFPQEKNARQGERRPTPQLPHPQSAHVPPQLQVSHEQGVMFYYPSIVLRFGFIIVDGDTVDLGAGWWDEDKVIQGRFICPSGCSLYYHGLRLWQSNFAITLHVANTGKQQDDHKGRRSQPKGFEVASAEEMFGS